MKPTILRPIVKTKRKSVRLKAERCARLRTSLATAQHLTEIRHRINQQKLTETLLTTFLGSPFVTAPHGVSRATGICASSVANMGTGGKTAHSTEQLITPTAQLQETPVRSREHNSPQRDVNDKYFENFDSEFAHDCNAELDLFLKQINYFEERSFLEKDSFKGVKGRLSKNLKFWEDIGANPFVIDTIKNGYVIPFLEPPRALLLKNNKSALQNNDFVTQMVSDLVCSGCVIEVPFTPHIVNPLSVATQKSGKKRLILDLSILNKSIKKDKVKFEDWKIAIQYFHKNSYMFKFDLSSGYFHLDVCPQQQTFLGFSWNNRFYCFTVLVFGICTGPYIFTKCLRPLVKHWRENGISVVLY